MISRRGAAHLAALAAAATTLLTLGLASPTQAHDELESSTPATGAKLDKLPAHATLVFSEALGPDDLTIKTAGTRLKVEAVAGKPSTLQVDLSSVKPAKTVLLAWQAEEPRRRARELGSDHAPRQGEQQGGRSRRRRRMPTRRPGRLAPDHLGDGRGPHRRLPRDGRVRRWPAVHLPALARRCRGAPHPSAAGRVSLWQASSPPRRPRPSSYGGGPEA